MIREPLTASRMACKTACDRKHFFRYELGMKPTTESEVFVFGRAFHRGLQARALRKPFEEALADACPESLKMDAYQCATLAPLLAHYYRVWDGENIVQMIPEFPFRYPLKGSNSFDVCGIVDGLCVYSNGMNGIIEHKTTSSDLSPDSDYWQRLRFNTQIFQYVMAARALGYECEMVTYDVIRKPLLRPSDIPLLDENGLKIVEDANGVRMFNKNNTPKQSADKEMGWTVKSRRETPEEYSERLYADIESRPDWYFARREVPVLDSDLEAFVAHRLNISRIILMQRQNEKRMSNRCQAWPRNVTEFTCKWCEYSSFCLQSDTINPAQPPTGFKIGEANSELKEAGIII